MGVDLEERAAEIERELAESSHKFVPDSLKFETRKPKPSSEAKTDYGRNEEVGDEWYQEEEGDYDDSDTDTDDDVVVDRSGFVVEDR